MPLELSSGDDRPPTEAVKQPLITVGADVDAATLIRDILAEVKRKQGEGLYPADLMADIELAMDPLESALEDVRRAATFSFQPPASSRRRIVGVPVTLVKSGLSLSLRWYTQWVMAQMSTFASSVVALATGWNDRVKQHDSRLDQVSKEFTEGFAQIREEVLQLSHLLLQGDPKPLVKSRNDSTNTSEQTDPSRGIPDSEEARGQLIYVDLFRQRPGPVVHIDCGRGELLIAMTRAGIRAYGVDFRSDMAAHCRQQGLQVRQEDAMRHLADVAVGSLGGVFSSHLVERLEPRELVQLFQLAAQALSDGGLLVVEAHKPKNHLTLDGVPYMPAGLGRAIHPHVLAFLAESAGLHDVEIRYLVNTEQLRPRHLDLTADPSIRQLMHALNENFRRIDVLLFGRPDFAVIARR